MQHFRISLAIAGVLALAARLSATTLLSAGFEPGEGFTLNQPVSSPSQVGWLSVGAGTSLTGIPTAGIASAGTSALFLDSTQIAQNAWWYKPINFNTASSAEKLIKISWSQRVNTTNLGAPTVANSSQYGVVCYDSSGHLINGLIFDSADANFYSFDGSALDWMTAGATGNRDAFENLTIWLNYEAGTAKFERNGTPMAVTGSVQTSSAVFGDADIVLGDAKFDSAYFDALSVTSMVPGQVRGTVSLGDFVGDVATRDVTVEVRQPGTGSVVETGQPSALNSSGAFAVKLQSRGTYDLAIKSSTHLSVLVSNVNLRDEGGDLAPLTLPLNGDCDGSNVITTDDYLVLSGAFDTVIGDPLYVMGADLNGDGVVTTDDYLILSGNFDLAGD